MHKRLTQVVLLISWSLLLAGCEIGELPRCNFILQEEAQNRGLPFETLERKAQESFDRMWQSRDSGLLVIAGYEDIQAVSRYVTEEAKTTLRQLDFTTHLAVIVFFGMKDALAFDFCIEEIIRENREIDIFAHVIDRGFGAPAVGSPYHLVVVSKEKEV